MNELPLRYIDEALLVVDKPSGLLAVPGRGEPGRDNLAARLQAQHADVQAVHRLDMATSGLMVYARGPQAQRALSRAFELRQVHKRYEAIVEGELSADTGEIDAPMGADWPQRPRQKIDLENGKPSLTRWQVLQRGGGCTRLALWPLTGRSHQLRVHLLHIGHPIRGDALYAPEPLRAERLLLHATELGFAHPQSGAPLAFHSPAPF